MRKFLPFILALCLIVSGCSSSGGSSDRLAQDSISSADNSLSPSYGLTADGSMDAAHSDAINDSEVSSSNGSVAKSSIMDDGAALPLVITQNPVSPLFSEENAGFLPYFNKTSRFSIFFYALFTSNRWLPVRPFWILPCSLFRLYPKHNKRISSFTFVFPLSKNLWNS